MNIGILVPKGHLQKDIPVIKKKFPDISIQILIYSSVSRIPGIISETQQELDSLLFLGKTTMNYVASKISPSVPWDVIPRTSNTLFMSLLKARLAGNDICKLITDIHEDEKQILRDVYLELGINLSDVSITCAPPFSFDETFVKQMKGFYYENHRLNPSATCLTIYSDVYRALHNTGFPVQYYYCGLTDIYNSIDKAHTNFLLQISRESQLVIIHIIINESSEYSPLMADEYQSILETLHVTKYIYTFAQKIRGAVSSISEHEFLIFSTRAILKNQTDEYHHFSLIDDLTANTASTISMGIGFGRTAQEAKAHAKLGVKQAQKSNGNQIFLVYDKKTIRSFTAAPNDTAVHIPDRFLTLSSKTGISSFTLGEIHKVITEYGKSEFTAAELAKLLHISMRSMNRTILKLMDTGCCFEIGKKFQHNGGRPSRILRFKL